MNTRSARISLAVWIAALLVCALSVSRVDLAVPVWDLQDTGQLLEWLAHRVLLALGVILLFLPLGALAVGALVPLDEHRGGWNRLGRMGAALTLAVAVAALVDILRVLPPLRPPTLLGMCLAVSGCVVGTWMGMRARRGKLRRLALESAVAASVLAMGAVGATRLALSEAPLALETLTVTSEDKRRLVGLVQGKNPRKIHGDDTRTLRLTEDDANRLLAWGLSVGSEGRKARVRLDRGSVELSLSFRLPRPVLGRSYLNCVIEEHVGFDGRLRLGTARLDVGRLSLPRWSLALLSRALVGELERDDHVWPLVEAIRRLEIAPDGASVTYGRVEVPPNYTAEVLARFGRSDSEVAATHAYLERLSEIAYAESPSFARCFESAFELARRRSADGDPILENRGAVFALGIVLGHERVRTLAGPVDVGRVSGPSWYYLQRVTLRGRRDWAQHFTVSAAVKLLSNVATSNTIGLLKEELDAGEGGSGFSFSDLLADRAGTTFARVAVRSRESAIALQEWIGRGFRVHEFFPPAGDLPEGIPDAELERVYGGVGGGRYRELTDEIERRVASCAAYRSLAAE